MTTSRPPTTTFRSDPDRPARRRVSATPRRAGLRPQTLTESHPQPSSSASGPSLLAIERYLPPYRYPQEEVSRYVRDWLADDPVASRLVSVYDTAGVKTRASVLPLEEVFHPRDFETQNERFGDIARAAGADLVERALLSAGVSPADVSMIVSVSCTGFMIPAVDAYVADRLRLGPRLVRLPITESGCAGGVVGLARALDHLVAHPEGVAVVLALEMASLTFQRWDHAASNVVSTAIFGDGGAAVVLAGPAHARASAGALRLASAASVFFPGTTHLMGFRLKNPGLQIVLDKSLAPFVRRNVGRVVDEFLAEAGLTRDDVDRWVLHPGGRRIIEVMCEQLDLGPDDLAATEAVLADHGNMSSVTVLFVLDEILRRHRPPAGARGVVGAFGPGFGAEFMLVTYS